MRKEVTNLKLPSMAYASGMASATQTSFAGLNQKKGGVSDE